MANSKTWSQRILNAAVKDGGDVSKETLRRRMRISEQKMSSPEFHNTVMRTVRYMAEDRLLKRVAPGQYTLTQKGVRQAVVA